MLDEFIDFTASLFPSIDPYIKEKTKDAIEQFYKSGKELQLFNYAPFDYLAQGDIFEGIPFVSLDEEGEILGYTGKGMLISNTCSADHDEDVIFAPLIDLDIIGLNESDVKSNQFYRLFYLPDVRYKGYAVDFSLFNTINKEMLNYKIDSGEVVKETSLNQFGFYLLLCKLTVCFMRPEDEKVQDERRDNYIKLHYGD